MSQDWIYEHLCNLNEEDIKKEKLRITIQKLIKK